MPAHPTRARRPFRRPAPLLLLGGIAAAAAGILSQGPPQAAEPSKLPTLEKPRALEPLAGPAQRVLTPDQVPLGALVPPGPAPVLGIFGTGDVIGYLEPCG